MAAATELRLQTVSRGRSRARIPDIESIESSPAVVNDAEGATRTRPAVEDLVGPDRLIEP
jgi:hypothetical protein